MQNSYLPAITIWSMLIILNLLFFWMTEILHLPYGICFPAYFPKNDFSIFHCLCFEAYLLRLRISLHSPRDLEILPYVIISFSNFCFPSKLRINRFYRSLRFPSFHSSGIFHSICSQLPHYTSSVVHKVISNYVP